MLKSRCLFRLFPYSLQRSGTPFSSYHSGNLQQLNAGFLIKLITFLMLAVTPILYITSITILTSTITDSDPSVVVFSRIAHVSFHGVRSAISVIFITLALQLDERDAVWFVNMAVAGSTIAYNVKSILFTLDLVCPVDILFAEWFSIVLLCGFIVTVGVFVEEAVNGKENRTRVCVICLIVEQPVADY